MDYGDLRRFNIDKLIYLRNVPEYLGKDIGDREPVKVEFDVPEDMDINEFKNACIRLAQALGYNTNNIKDTFGIIEDKNKDKKLLLD